MRHSRLAFPLRAPRAVPELASTDLGWDRAVSDFLDHKAPLLLTSLDAVPLIAKRANFPWNATLAPPIPQQNHNKMQRVILGGSDLVVTQDSPGVRSFLAYLYSTQVAGRWTAAGGFVPLRKENGAR